MSEESVQTRLNAFLRTVIPADPAQLLLLAGVVCLVFAPRMSSWPGQMSSFLSRSGTSDWEVRYKLVPFIVMGMQATLFSAMAGYFVCFWPGRRAVRRVLFSVLLPAVVGFCVVMFRFAYVGRPTSILDKNVFGSPMPFAQWAWWASTPASHVALVGISFVGIFTSRMVFGISCLPLALPESSVQEDSDPQFWRRIQFLIWVLVGPLFLLAVIPGAGIALVAFVFSANASALLQNPLFSYSASLIGAITLLVVACWIAGKTGRESIKNSIRLSKPKYLLLAAGFPVGIAVLISSAQYSLERAHWAARQFGKTPPPPIGSYFGFPPPWFLFMFFAAFSEEVVFRGLLQTTFIRRYGLYRGIFLTGTVWAAYHFNSDAFTHPTELGVLSKLGFRMTMCLAMGFVLSWLTFRSSSVLPAAIAHTLHNVLVSDFGPSFPGKSMVWVALWGVLAWFLFRYWPTQGPDQFEVGMPTTEPGIAD